MSAVIMQLDHSPEGSVNSRASVEAPQRRKPTKVLKIAESFTNLDETAKSGRFVRGPHSKLGRRYRSDGPENGKGRNGAGVCCDDDVYKDTSVSEECERLGDRRVTGSSCTALRTAVAALYPFDDFVLEKIGSGFFSEVFKVTHKTSGKVMVLKQNQQRANRPNMLREVQLMNKLKHPHILGFMGVCVHEGQLHALTEYMEEGALEQLILGRAPMPQRLRISLAADIAAGMRYLHDLGVFHRDLTAKNVLLRNNGDGDYTAVVADFGLAAKIPHPVNGYRLPSVGSPWWMSPECLRGRWYDHRSDIFSYGIIVCQLIARVDADPDVLPRTDNFGLNYMTFVDLCDEQTVPEFLKLAFDCCIYSPKARPLFPAIVSRLASIADGLDEAEWSAHTAHNSVECEEMDSSGPRSCPGLYAWRRPARIKSEGSTRSHDPLQHRRSLSELEWWDSGGGHVSPMEKARVHRPPAPAPAPCAYRSASALPPPPPAAPPPPRLARLHRLAHITALRDPCRPARPSRPLDRYRGVQKILEPCRPSPAAAPPPLGFSSCVELPSPRARLAADCALSDCEEPARCASLPSSPAASRRASPAPASPPPPRLLLHKSSSSIELSAELSTRGAGGAGAGAGGGAGGGGSRRRGSCESGIFSVANEDCCGAEGEGEDEAGGGCCGAVCPCSLMGCQRCWWWRGRGPVGEGGEGVRLCQHCLVLYDRVFLSRAYRPPPRAAPPPPSSSANSSLFLLDDSALSTTTVSSLRSLDDLDEHEPPLPPPPPPPPPPATHPHSEHSPFLCGTVLDGGYSDASSEAGTEREYHVLHRCCCSAPPAPSPFPSPAAPAGAAAAPHRCHQRTSSVYTDSSEDVASLAGSDSLCCDERLPRHVRSAQISKIVDYFERKGGDFKHSRFHLGKWPLLQLTQEYRDRVDVKHRGRTACLAQQRLMVCEGAVKSKLPLFDKKT